MIYFREIKELASKNRLSEEAMEKDYCLNWLLLGLSSISSAKDLVFFGGTSLRKIYFEDYRLSEDLDFMYGKRLSRKSIFLMMDEVFSILRKKANINYSIDASTISEEAARLQFFVKYDGFPELSMPTKSFKLDFSLELGFIENPLRRKILELYTDMAGEKGSLFCYSLEAIAAEKLGAILGKIRHEPRDVYDLWYLINSKLMNKKKVLGCFKRKYDFLPKYADIKRALNNDIYRKMWQVRLKNQISDLIEYDKATNDLLKSFI